MNKKMTSNIIVGKLSYYYCYHKRRPTATCTSVFSNSYSYGLLFFAILQMSQIGVFVRSESSPKADFLSPTNRPSSLIMISFDGFRWDYPSKFKEEMPFLQKLIQSGVFAPDGITCGFESMTLSNHFTLATGLYSDSHGLLSNLMYDSRLKKVSLIIVHNIVISYSLAWLKD